MLEKQKYIKRRDKVMKVTHSDAIELENIVSGLCESYQSGMGGIISADRFERNPFQAALICVSKLYKGEHDSEIDQFVTTWETVFNYPEENQEYTIEQYIGELKIIIALLQ